MINSGKTLTVLTALLALAAPGDRLLAADGKPGKDALETLSGGESPPRSSRLRFRSGGPACMCVSGMSEAEISAAERKRELAVSGRQTTRQDP